MGRVEMSDQWLSGGDCKLCRRKNYCKKSCKASKHRRLGMFVSAAQEILTECLTDTQRDRRV